MEYKSGRNSLLSFALLILSLLVAPNAIAQYTCNDRDYLRETLRRLEAQCGGWSGASCTSLGYKGSTPESATAACVKYSNYAESSCNRNVSCSSGTSICTTLGFSGSTAAAATAACVKYSNYAESSCNRNVSCSGALLCESLGYKGSTIEQAIAACSKYGNYAESSCARFANCN